MSIYISEIFGPTIQGEGSLIGMPTVFVRVGGCDYRCSWCDSLYAVQTQFKAEWRKMESHEILAQVKKLSNHQPLLITLSGGNPALYDFSELIKIGHSDGFRFTMETQGSVTKPYFKRLDYLTVSPKPPSSKMPFDAQKLTKTLDSHPSPHLKIVVADESDYAFAKHIHQSHPQIPLTVQPCNADAQAPLTDRDALQQKLEWLIEKVHQDALYNVRVLPQLHVMLWHNKRGV